VRARPRFEFGIRNSEFGITCARIRSSREPRDDRAWARRLKGAPPIGTAPPKSRTARFFGRAASREPRDARAWARRLKGAPPIGTAPPKSRTARFFGRAVSDDFGECRGGPDIALSPKLSSEGAPSGSATVEGRADFWSALLNFGREHGHGLGRLFSGRRGRRRGLRLRPSERTAARPRPPRRPRGRSPR